MSAAAPPQQSLAQGKVFRLLAFSLVRVSAFRPVLLHRASGACMASGSPPSNVSSSRTCSNVCPASIEPSQILDGSYLGTLAKEHAAAF